MTNNNQKLPTPLVLFDATSIPLNRGGVGRVIESTIPFLSQNTHFDFHVVCKAEHATEFQMITSKVHVAPRRVSHTAYRLWWEQTGLPRLAHSLKAQLVFSPHYTYPLRGKFARVVMIHDLTFFSLPQLHSRFKRLFFRSWIRRLARNTKIGVVTPSSATAQEFYHLAPNAPRRTTVALLGYDNSLFSPPSARDITAFTSTLTPPVTQWIAFLGTLEPRKNVPALINAFSSLPSSLTTNTALLLSGGPGWDEAVEPAIMKAQLGGLNVRKLGYLPQEQLKSFLGGAELVVYPSLGEGFGLPVLEAMACGAAVLTTRELSLPEVGGDVAFYTDTDAMSISENLAELLKNPSSLARAKTLGPERAKTFSWASTAEAMAQAISKELSGRSL